MALLGLAFGCILVAPMLSRLSSGYAIDQQAADKLHEQYAADAAIEYGIQRLRVDTPLVEALSTQVGSPLSLSVPAPVNAISPTLQVTLVQTQALVAEWSWAIWAKSEVLIEKNNTVINGDVHCNGPVTITGNNTVIDGEVEANTGEQPYPLEWLIEDMRPSGTWGISATLEGMYFVHDQAEWRPSLSDDLVPGLHYATGNVVIDDNGVNGQNVTLVAEGSIHFTKNKNAYLSPYVPGLSLFSNATATDAILIDGNKLTSAGGVLYAPNGTIDLAGNNAVLDGAILVADRVAITKNDAIIQLPIQVSVDGSVVGACYTFDLLSQAGGTHTASRIQACPDGLRVLSWSIY